MKPIVLLTQRILEQQRCVKIFGQISGGKDEEGYNQLCAKVLNMPTN